MAEYDDEQFFSQEDYGTTITPLGQGATYQESYSPFAVTEDDVRRRNQLIQDMLSERRAALTGLEGQREALLGGIAGEREAAEASIRAARQGAARSMMGLAGGTGGLAGSGAVRAGLAQSGFEAANKEQMARQAAAKNIMGIETQAEGMRADIEEARSGATLQSLEDEAVADAVTYANDLYNANIGAGEGAIENAIDMLEKRANDSPFPEVRKKMDEMIFYLRKNL